MLLDLQMPIKNGLDVVEEIKKYYHQVAVEHDQELTQDLFLSPPIFILWSANLGNENLRKHAKKVGVDHFFEKPITTVGLKNFYSVLGF